MSIIDFLKSLFSIRQYTFGAFESPKDERNISTASFQKPVNLPDDYETPLPPVEDQKSDPKCVGEGIHKIAELYFKKQGIDVNLSPDDLYNHCKLVDGLPGIQGTYPSVGAAIACNRGIATEDAYSSGDLNKILESRAAHRLGGYAFVPSDFESVCQSIYQYGAIGASFLIDRNWFIGKIKRVIRSLGRHYVVLNGFRYSDLVLKAQNSWGVGWIGYIAGIFDERVKPGNFEVNWMDVNDNIIDLIVFADIPQELIDNARGTPYQFTRTLRLGSRDYDVVQLQKLLNVKPTDGIFGKDTQKAVKIWQAVNHLDPDGIFGPTSRKVASLKKKTI